MPDGPVAHQRVDADRLFAQRAAVYHGGLLVATGDGSATVAVYDGLDANGELIDYFTATTSARDRNFYERGLKLLRGLYVDIGSNVSAFDIFYEPVPREEG